jgi:hypothetical protein
MTTPTQPTKSDGLLQLADTSQLELLVSPQLLGTILKSMIMTLECDCSFLFNQNLKDEDKVYEAIMEMQKYSYAMRTQEHLQSLIERVAG